MDPLKTLETDQLRPGVTVAICCHNSSARLTETLRHLQAQNVDANISWEVILIDNASSDATAGLARTKWSAFAPASLRIIDEPKLGLSCARIRALREARYEIVSFIDDDNWVPPDWTERIYCFFSTHPTVTVLGCASEAVFETLPPTWIKSIEGFFALGSQHTFSGDVTDEPGTLLWGAGLAVRKQAVLNILGQGFSFNLSDRTGTTMSTGGDTELCFALRAAGARLWYEESLRLKHFVPKERLTSDYAKRLFKGMGAASPWVDLYLTAISLDSSPWWKRTWGFAILKNFKGLVRYLLCSLPQLARKEAHFPVQLGFTLRFHSMISLWNLRHSYKAAVEQLHNSSARWNIHDNQTARTNAHG